MRVWRIDDGDCKALYNVTSAAVASRELVPPCQKGGDVLKKLEGMWRMTSSLLERTMSHDSMVGRGGRRIHERPQSSCQ
jgi:hypothetical protein